MWNEKSGVFLAKQEHKPLDFFDFKSRISTNGDYLNKGTGGFTFNII